MIADTTYGDAGGDTGSARSTVAAGAMATIYAILLASFEDRMLGHDLAKVENADEIRQLLNFDDTTGAIRNSLTVASHR